MHPHSSEEMGPGAFMWPKDRPWSDEHDNKFPCGTNYGPGERTPFPLTNGKLALVTQAETHNVHVGVSYLEDPQRFNDFRLLLSAVQLPSRGSLGIGHTCVSVADAPANVTAGDTATFNMWYRSANDEYHFACADIVYVDALAEDTIVPCFNATSDEPHPSFDSSVDPASIENPHEVEEDSGSGRALNTAAIAGGVVGAAVFLAMLGLLALFLVRRRKANRTQVEHGAPEMTAKERALRDDVS